MFTARREVKGQCWNAFISKREKETHTNIQSKIYLYKNLHIDDRTDMTKRWRLKDMSSETNRLTDGQIKRNLQVDR